MESPTRVPRACLAAKVVPWGVLQIHLDDRAAPGGASGAPGDPLGTQEGVLGTPLGPRSSHWDPWQATWQSRDRPWGSGVLSVEHGRLPRVSVEPCYAPRPPRRLPWEASQLKNVDKRKVFQRFCVYLWKAIWVPRKGPRTPFGPLGRSSVISGGSQSPLESPLGVAWASPGRSWRVVRWSLGSPRWS